jgi:hypothetical protein
MSHILRPLSDSSFSFPDAIGGVPRCLLVLDSAVRKVLTDFWEDGARTRARDLAASLLTGCRECGFRESSGLLRSLLALLSMSVDSTAGIQMSLAERLLDLVGLLKERARVSRN